MNLSDTPVKKTRSAHRCVWCGIPIEIGQSAHRTADMFEGYFQHGYFHPECWDALQGSADVQDGWAEGEQPRGVALDEYGDPVPLPDPGGSL